MKNSLLLLLAALSSSSCSTSEFECNCDGEVITNCLPYEASEVLEASVTPEGVVIGDVSETVQVQIRLRICENVPRPHEVTMRMRVGEGEGARIIDLETFRDDGMTHGDSVAMDGMIDVEVANPFVNPLIPVESDVFVRFEARSPADCSSGRCLGGTCRSEIFELPYETGPAQL